jgi:hypothetical protein
VRTGEWKRRKKQTDEGNMEETGEWKRQEIRRCRRNRREYGSEGRIKMT